MCRHNGLFGLVSLAFGAGLLIGKWVGGGFLFHCLGILLILAGGMLLCRNR